MEESKNENNGSQFDGDGGVQLTCFSEESDGDALLHFQIIRLQKQVVLSEAILMDFKMLAFAIDYACYVFA